MHEEVTITMPIIQVFRAHVFSLPLLRPEIHDEAIFPYSCLGSNPFLATKQLTNSTPCFGCKSRDRLIAVRGHMDTWQCPG